jgi:hypothetical protein
MPVAAGLRHHPVRRHLDRPPPRRPGLRTDRRHRPRPALADPHRLRRMAADQLLILSPTARGRTCRRSRADTKSRLSGRGDGGRRAEWRGKRLLRLSSGYFPLILCSGLDQPRMTGYGDTCDQAVTWPSHKCPAALPVGRRYRRGRLRCVPWALISHRAAGVCGQQPKHWGQQPEHRGQQPEHCSGAECAFCG